MKTLLMLLVIIVLAGGGYYWYSQQTATPSINTDTSRDAFGTDSGSGQNTPSGTNTGTGASGGVNVDVGGSVSTGQVREIKVSNSGMTFNPKTLSVSKGERVKITFNNTGGTHDLRIEGYNVGTKVIAAGQTESFEFVADKAGDFVYYCSVGNHRAQGMWGTLTVK